MLTDKKLQDLKKQVYELQIHIKSCSDLLESIIIEIEENEKPMTTRQSNKLKREAEMRDRMNYYRQMLENKKPEKPIDHKRK